MSKEGTVAVGIAAVVMLTFSIVFFISASATAVNADKIEENILNIEHQLKEELPDDIIVAVDKYLQARQESLKRDFARFTRAFNSELDALKADIELYKTLLTQLAEHYRQHGHEPLPRSGSRFEKVPDNEGSY